MILLQFVSRLQPRFRKVTVLVNRTQGHDDSPLNENGFRLRSTLSLNISLC